MASPTGPEAAVPSSAPSQSQSSAVPAGAAAQRDAAGTPAVPPTPMPPPTTTPPPQTTPKLGSADSARLRGNAAYARGDWDAALAAYTAALEMDPHEARLHSNRAAAYIAKHRALAEQGARLPGLVGLAVADATAATAYRPTWQDGWYRLYAAHFEAGSLRAAVRALQMGIRQCQDADALKNALADMDRVDDRQDQQQQYGLQPQMRRGNSSGSPTSPTLTSPRRDSRHGNPGHWRRQPGKDPSKTEQRHSSFTEVNHSTSVVDHACDSPIDDGFATDPLPSKDPVDHRGQRRERNSLTASTLKEVDAASQGDAMPSTSPVVSPLAFSRMPFPYSRSSQSQGALVGNNGDLRSHAAALVYETRGEALSNASGNPSNPDKGHFSVLTPSSGSAQSSAVSSPPLRAEASTTPLASKADAHANSGLLSATSSVHVSRRETKLTASDALRFEANDQFRAGNWDKAIEGYTRSIQVANDSGEDPDRRAMSNRSAAWLRKAIETDEPHAFERAISDADRCIELDPAWPKAWFRKGSALLEDGRPAQARVVLEQGLKVCPNDSNLLEALRQAEGVIAEEGEETDYEDTATSVPVSSRKARHARKQDPDSQAEQPGAGSVRQIQAKKSLSYSRWSTGLRAMREESSHSALSSGGFQPRVQSSRANTIMPGTTSRKASDALPPPRKTPVQAASVVPPVSAKGSELGQDSPIEPSLQTAGPTATGASSSTSAKQARDGANGSDKGVREAQKQGDEGRGDTGIGAGAGSADAAGATNALAGKPQTLYEVLNVPPDASEAVIRRSYYLAARELHPDKNPDDPNATHKFQRISDAYQVLSNPETRAAYDKHGEAGLEKSGIDAVDPQTLFAIVFGSDQFADYIGELKLTTLAANVGEDGQAPSQEVLDRLQAERVQRLVDKLQLVVEPWVKGERAAFMEWAEGEMLRLADTNFGAHLLGTVGNVYVHKVDILRGRSQLFGFPGLLKDASYRTQKLGAQLKANAATNRVMQGQRRLHERVMRLNREGHAISEGEAQEVAAEMARKAVDMMWKISVLDIQSTLEAVVDRVLSGVEPEAGVDARAGGGRSGAGSGTGNVAGGSGSGSETETMPSAAPLPGTGRRGASLAGAGSAAGGGASESQTAVGSASLSFSPSRPPPARSSSSRPPTAEGETGAQQRRRRRRDAKRRGPAFSAGAPSHSSAGTAHVGGGGGGTAPDAATAALRAEAVRALGRAMLLAARRRAPAVDARVPSS